MSPDTKEPLEGTMDTEAEVEMALEVDEMPEVMLLAMQTAIQMASNAKHDE